MYVTKSLYKTTESHRYIDIEKQWVDARVMRVSACQHHHSVTGHRAGTGIAGRSLSVTSRGEVDRV